MKADGPFHNLKQGKVDIAKWLEGDEEKLGDVLFELESSHDELVTPYDATARNGRNKRPFDLLFLPVLGLMCISPEGFLLPVLLVVVIIVTVVIVIVIPIVVVDDVSLILSFVYVEAFEGVTFLQYSRFPVFAKGVTVVEEEDGEWIYFLGGNSSSGTKKYRGSNSSDGGNTRDGVKIAGEVIGSGGEIEFSEELKELLPNETGK
ncbi:hypothetical protein Tco_1028543 [Tanacetum coccineum]|uniref:Uncharacterized protein n=1 Tax=Tanacetum coccineum TaxID=301880 RepID=A0ABQ5G0Z4_9ASTR